MLVLTRKSKESLIIGEEIRITIVRVGAGQVRIGIEAPPHIPVLRAEVLNTTEGTSLLSASDDGPDPETAHSPSVRDS